MPITNEVIKISELPSGASIVGTEEVPGVQSLSTVKFLWSQVLTYIATATATFTNKTLTSPTITTPTINGGTATSQTITTPAITGGTASTQTLTTPRFADLGFIADQNGNEMLAFNSNTSAVNYLEVENGTTTNPPHIRSKGDDTNIGMHIVGKGTGEVSVCDGIDETKRLRFNVANNGAGIITTLRSNSTGTSKTIDLPNTSGTIALITDITASSILNTRSFI